MSTDLLPAPSRQRKAPGDFFRYHNDHDLVKALFTESKKPKGKGQDMAKDQFVSSAEKCSLAFPFEATEFLTIYCWGQVNHFREQRTSSTSTSTSTSTMPIAVLQDPSPLSIHHIRCQGTSERLLR